MYPKPSDVTTLRAELERLGLLGRVDESACAGGLDTEVERTPHVVADEGTGRLFMHASGPVLYTWATVGRSGKARAPFRTRVGFAVVLLGSFDPVPSRALRLALVGIA